MTGLIWKDIFVIRKTIVYMIVISLLFGGIYSFMDNSYFMAFFISIMMVSILISTMSYDEFYHWDRYAAILPLSRRQIVGAKYIASLLLFGGGMLFTMVLQGGTTVFQGRSFSLDDLLFMGIAPLVGILGLAVVLPCCYRFGTQQSRMILMAIYGVPTILLVLVLKFFPDTLQGAALDFSIGKMFLGLLSLTLLALAVSYLTAVHIVEKKELK